MPRTTDRTTNRETGANRLSTLWRRASERMGRMMASNSAWVKRKRTRLMRGGAPAGTMKVRMAIPVETMMMTMPETTARMSIS